METPEERESCLHQLEVSQYQRLASETHEERKAHLHQVTVSRQQRLTPEERGAHLHQLRVSRQQRLAAETPEETEVYNVSTGCRMAHAAIKFSIQ